MLALIYETLALIYGVWWYVVVLISVWFVVCTVVLARSDCDLILWCCCRWGKKPDHVLSGKVVWVTGASSGIGESLCYALAKCGAVLVLSARREQELRKVLQTCKELSPENSKEKHMMLPMDLIAKDKHSNFVDKVLKQFDKIDMLVNNAGRSQRGEAICTELKVDSALLDLNFLSTISLTKAVLPSMVEQGGGTVVVVSSVVGKIGSPGSATYSASKHALQGYFDTLRMEVSDKNISILSVCPGPIDTPFLRNIFREKMSSPTDEKSLGRPKDTRVTAERCAELMTVAMANDLKEVWISLQPILLFVYVSQYLPVPAKWLGNRIGIKRMKAVRRGELEIDVSLRKLV